MSIIVVCSSCGSAYEFSGHLAGKTIKCYKCAAPIFIPAEAASP